MILYDTISPNMILYMIFMIIISHFPIFGIFQHINTVILISIHQFTTYYTDYTSQYFYISPYIRVYTIHIYSNISCISPDNIIIGFVYGKIETGTRPIFHGQNPWLVKYYNLPR